MKSIVSSWEAELKLQQILIVSAATLIFCVSCTRAQEQQSQGDPSAPISPLTPQNNNDSSNRQAPVPAARGLFPSANSQDQGAGQIQPDTHLLSGGETAGLGSLNGLRNLFDPSLRLAESVDTGVAIGHADSMTLLGGNVTFDWHSTRYHLIALYSGAKSFYYPDSSYSQAYHNFGISQEIQWGRWTLHLRDSLVASPGSSFGGLYTGMAGSTGQSGALTNIAPTLSSGQTILTGQVNSLNNTAMSEIDYAVSRRTAVTFTGSYGLINFLGQGYLDSHSVSGSVGYNYALDSKNSFAITYNYSRTSFTANGNLMQTHLAQIGFGRKITGRLAFQVSAGPQLLQLHNYGSSTGLRWTWSVSSALTYQMTRITGFNFSYFHGTTAGSGVFLGAESDTVTGAINHQFTRFWSASVNAGYAHNSSLAPASTISNGYDTWYSGVSLFRQIGRQFRLGANYGLQQQGNSAGGCPVLSCGLPNSWRHLATISLEWHPLANRSE